MLKQDDSTDRTRFELLALAQAFLQSLCARDPGQLPISSDARFTENAQSIAFGKGLWRTAQAPITYTNIVADAASSEVGGFAVIRENGHQIILGFRLKARGASVCELETVVVRGMGPLFSPQSLILAKPVFGTGLTAAERAPRETMIRVANQYFEGLEQADGNIIPFDSAIVRTENGLRTTNNPQLGHDTIYTEALLHLGPAEQLNSKFFSYIRTVRDRRLSIVDEARGLVFGTVMFDHPGDLEYADRADGTRVMMPPESRWPSSALLAYLFKIRNELILEIETAYLILPYGSPSGWALPGGTA